MIGPFMPVLCGFWYVYVTIDKFSKWIEYKPLVSATAKKAVELFEDIIHRFGLPNSIITKKRHRRMHGFVTDHSRDSSVTISFKTMTNRTSLLN